MKILYTATVASHICQFHLPHFKAFREMGHEIHVAARDNLAEKNGLKMEYVDKFFNIPFRRSPISPKNAAAKKQLKKIIDEGNYDLIVCNTPVGGIVTRSAAKGARKRGTRVVYIAHGFHFYRGAPKKNWLLYYPIEKFFAKRCDIVVTITAEDFKLAAEKFKTKIAHIHGLGVDGLRHHPVNDEEKLSIRKELGIDENLFICLCTGEINDNKNQAKLVSLVPQILKSIQGFKLLLAGNGPNGEKIKAQIAQLGIEENVELLGYRPNIEKYIRACDVAASVSKREGLPFNIVEAQLAARPVVCSNNRGHRELVDSGVNGFICNTDAEIVDAIVTLYKDSDTYALISENAKSTAQKYTVQSVKGEVFEILFGKE